MLQVGIETRVPALGREWIFSRVEMRLIEEFRDWIASRIGDPFAAVERFAGKLPDDQVIALFREAEAVRDGLASFSIGNALSQRFISTELGAARITYLLLRTAHQDITPETAFQVFLAIGSEKLSEALRRGMGVPNDEPAQIPVPRT